MKQRNNALKLLPFFQKVKIYTVQPFLFKYKKLYKRSEVSHYAYLCHCNAVPLTKNSYSGEITQCKGGLLLIGYFLSGKDCGKKTYPVQWCKIQAFSNRPMRSS